MERSKGLAMCGLACCLCTESGCAGCTAGDCTGKDWCEVRKCCTEKGVSHCYECPETECRKGLLGKTKPRGFTAYARKYGAERLIDRLEENEKNGAVYHREGFEGDYDGFQTEKELFEFIENGRKALKDGKA